MIEKALNTLGVERCKKCGKLNRENEIFCKRCDYNMKAETSTPEDGLTE